MDTDAFVKQVRDLHERINYGHHPFWQKVYAGEVEARAIGGWVIQNGYQVKYGGIGVLLPLAHRVQDEEMRRKILDNLTGEIIGIRGVEDHWELARRMARACGWTDDEIDRERALPELRGMLAAMVAASSWSATVEPALAAITISSEQTFGDVCPRVYKAIRDHYQLDEESIEYLSEHAEADLEHAEAGWEMVRMAGLSEDRQALTMTLYEQFADLWWSFYDAVERRYIAGEQRHFDATYDFPQNGLI